MGTKQDQAGHSEAREPGTGSLYWVQLDTAWPWRVPQRWARVGWDSAAAEKAVT